MYRIYTVIIKLFPSNNHQKIIEITGYQLCILSIIEIVHQKPDSKKLPGLEAQALNTSIPEAMERRSPVPGQSGLHSEFEATPGYIGKAHLKKRKRKKKENLQTSFSMM